MRTHPHTHPASLLHDITLRCPSQPHLVGSDERVSQLVLRSHVIRGDIAASAAGWARALRLLIRGCGRHVCFYVSPRLRQHVATNPQNMAVGQSVFAYRHKAPDTRRGRCRVCGSDQNDPGCRKQRCCWDSKPAMADDSVSHC